MQLNTIIKGQGFPVLCLHGHPGNGQTMAVFQDHLSLRFRTIAPDLRGYGHSHTNQDFAMTDHVNDLCRLLDKEEIDRCLVLGWSLGGILALELALQQGDRVQGLILVASAARPRGDHPPVGPLDYLYTAIAAIINVGYPGWQWNIDTFGKRSLLRYLIEQHTPSTYRYLTAAVPAYLQTSGFAQRALSRALRKGYDRLGDLDKISCPCLVLAGSGDRHITSTSSQETAQHLPKATWHLYTNTAHLFPWEIPQQVMLDIEQWLAAHPEIFV